MFVRAFDRAIAGYQKWLSPYLPGRCRFYPSCSHYARSCLSKYPTPQALFKIMKRLLRCQPFHPGGIDHP